MKPGFEEKTYENYFNTELDNRADVYFPFGQVQESGIGADSSFFLRSRRLWRVLGHPYFFHLPFEGVSLHEIAHDMEQYLSTEINNIPEMKANLLFQYKRSERINSPSGKEWQQWNQPYFRYDIYKEQQALLYRLAVRFGTQALVLYAAPAINDVNDLVELKRKRILIEHTNFRPAIELGDGKHHRNTYIRAGRHSIACSEPEQFGPFDLITKLKELERVELKNKKFIVEFVAGVQQVVLEDKVLGPVFQSELMQYTETGLDKYPLFYAMLTMMTFRELSGIQWIVAINRRSA